MTKDASRTSGVATNAQRWFEHLRSRVNLNAVDAEATKHVQLIVTGPRRSEFLDALRSGGEFSDDVIRSLETIPLEGTVADASAKALVYCPSADSTNGSLASGATLPFAVFVVRTGDAPATADLGAVSHSKKSARAEAGVYQVGAMTLAELRKHLLPDIARVYRSDEIALAAAIPAFRSAVAAKLTLDCAMNSLKVAAASAVADHIPVLGLITGSIASAGDTIAITALQMHMLLRIAAAYGKKPEFTRIIELAPVVGGGYGWRALARELSGFIPIAGIPIKAAIAYAGTLVVGQAASYYYETGSLLSPNAVGALYREASERAKGLVKSLTTRRKRD